jgi:hypothetical protein
LAALSVDVKAEKREAIVLDFMHPKLAGREFCGFCREAWRDETSREGTLQHVG